MAELEIRPSPRQRIRVMSVLLIANLLSLFLMYLLAGGGRDLIAQRTHLTTYMPDAGGITTASDVRLSGIRIGRVDKIELSGQLEPRHAVRVEMRVLSRYLRAIPEDSETDITADTLVGYQFIDIAEGKSPVSIKEEGTLESEPVKQAEDRADLFKTIQNDLTQVDQILADWQSPTSTLGAFINSEDVYSAAITHIRGFDESLHSFLNPQSDLGRAFYTNQFYAELLNRVKSFDTSLAAMQAGDGTAGHLLATDDDYNNLLRELTDLRKGLADLNRNGKTGAFLNDDAAWSQAKRLLRQLDQSIAALNAGQGTTGRLLTNAQSYESLNGSLHELELRLRDLRENPRRYLRIKP